MAVSEVDRRRGQSSSRIRRSNADSRSRVVDLYVAAARAKRTTAAFDARVTVMRPSARRWDPAMASFMYATAATRLAAAPKATVTPSVAERD